MNIQQTMRQLLATFLLAFCTLNSGAQDIKVTISDGISNLPVKQRMEKGISQLLSEINRACAQERSLQLDNIDMALGGKKSLQYLWQNFHLKMLKMVYLIHSQLFHKL